MTDCMLMGLYTETEEAWEYKHSSSAVYTDPNGLAFTLTTLRRVYLLSVQLFMDLPAFKTHWDSFVNYKKWLI